MLYSTSTDIAVRRPAIGLFRGVEMLMDAGFPALDLSLFEYGFVMDDDYRETAAKLKAMTSARGVVFNQSHAPFGGGYDKYFGQTAPNLPRVIEFAGLCGVRNIVIHPLQRGRYYGHEEELFEMNMEFYSGLAPHAKNAGVRIAIENMWHRHPVNGYIVDDVCANPDELAKYYDTLNDPEAFTVCLDLGHVALCGREPEDAVKTIGHRLGAIHAHDVDYVNDLHYLPGVGKLNWSVICRSLAEVDYKGDFTLEASYFPKNYPDAHMPSVLRFMSETAAFYAGEVEKYKKELAK